MSAYSLKPIDVTAATLSLEYDRHNNTMVTINRATGCVVTLPASTGSGACFKLFVGTTITSLSLTIQVANASDIIQGSLGVTTDAAGVVIPTAAATDTITMNGSTTGGVKGSFVELVDVAENVWAVSGSLVSTGVEATPFSAAVS